MIILEFTKAKLPESAGEPVQNDMKKQNPNYVDQCVCQGIMLLSHV